MLVAEIFIKSLIKSYGKHIVVYSDGGSWYPHAYVLLLFVLSIDCIHRLRKASLKNLFSTSRTKQNVLMTIILADVWVVRYIIYIQMDMRIHVYAKCCD
jgi:hypothetical protein